MPWVSERIDNGEDGQRKVGGREVLGKEGEWRELVREREGLDSTRTPPGVMSAGRASPFNNY